MMVDVTVVGVLLVIGNVLFRHFEPHMPLWRRVLKWLVLVGLTAAIRYSFGRTTLIVLFAIAVIAVLYVHAIWLPRGVNGWTAVPRDKYYALRGWPPPKD